MAMTREADAIGARVEGGAQVAPSGVSGVSWALDAVDRVRAGLWRFGCRFELGRRAVRDRSLRLALLASAHILVAFALTGVAPLWLLLLGPLLLGVPHVVNDVRFLVIRRPRGLTPAAVKGILTALALMTGARLVAVAGGPLLLDWEIALGGAAVTCGVALSDGPPLRRALIAAAAGALTVWAVGRPFDAALAVGHAHNLVAFGLWLAVAREGGPLRRVLAVAALYLACAVAILAGAFDGLFVTAWGGDAAGLDLDSLAASLAPGLEPTLAVRLVALFAFAQAVHYVVWLRLVPQRLVPRAAPPTVRRSLAGARADLGRAGLAVAVALTLLVPLLALADAPETRRIYLTLALFHGWLELAVIGAVLSARRGRAPLWTPAGDSPTQ